MFCVKVCISMFLFPWNNDQVRTLFLFHQKLVQSQHCLFQRRMFSSMFCYYHSVFHYILQKKNVEEKKHLHFLYLQYEFDLTQIDPSAASTWRCRCNRDHAVMDLGRAGGRRDKKVTQNKMAHLYLKMESEFMEKKP